MLFLLRIIFGKTIGLWLLKSLTDDKGEASSRRISALYLMVLYGVAHMSYLWIMHTSSDEIKVELAEHLVWMMGVDVVGALFYLGLVTVQNIQMGLETIKGQQQSGITETTKGQQGNNANPLATTDSGGEQP